MIIKDEAGRDRAFQKLASLNIEKPWELEFKPYEKNRTAAQNRLLFMWLGIWGKDLGYTEKEMYDVAVDQFWPLVDEELVVNGKVVLRQRRTSKLKVKPFTVFLNNVDIGASETGTVLPHPEDLYHEAMMK